MTVLAFERHPVDQNSVEAYEKLVDELLEAMRSSDGCLWADAAKAFDDEPSYIVLSEWRTGADLDAHEGRDRSTRDDLNLLLRGDPTRRRLFAES